MKRENILDKTSKENSEKETGKNTEYFSMLDNLLPKQKRGILLQRQ